MSIPFLPLLQMFIVWLLLWCPRALSSTGCVIYFWGLFVSLLAFVVEARPAGADPWGPLWLESAAQDKVLQQGADPWDP